MILLNAVIDSSHPASRKSYNDYYPYKATPSAHLFLFIL